jgi:hypothetical protein
MGDQRTAEAHEGGALGRGLMGGKAAEAAKEARSSSASAS